MDGERESLRGANVIVVLDNDAERVITNCSDHVLTSS